jgi:Uncharacterized conserved protein (DUF2203)
MTSGGEHDAGARPTPAAMGPRDDAPVIPLTPALATRMLPLVERIVTDVQEAWKEWRAAVSRYDTVLAAIDADAESKLARVAQRDVESRAAELESLRGELAPLGATCPTPRTGRVEWQTEVAGRFATLIWNPGDTEVSVSIDGDLVTVPDDAEEDDPSRP